MTEKQLNCDQIAEALSALVTEENIAPEFASHIEDCDTCRDTLHEARKIAVDLRKLGDDYIAPTDFTERVMSAIEKEPPIEVVKAPTEEKEPEKQALTETPSPINSEPRVNQKKSAPRSIALATLFSRNRFMVAGGGLALVAAAGIGIWLAIANHSPNSANWGLPFGAPRLHARVVAVSGEGLFAVGAGKQKLLKVGDTLDAGTEIRTDIRTMAKIAIDDGTKVAVARGSDITFTSFDSRQAMLAAGGVVVTSMPKESSITMKVPGGQLQSTGGRFAATVLESSPNTRRTSVAVGEGLVKGTSDSGAESTLSFGQGATIANNEITSERAGLARAFEWSEFDHEQPRDDSLDAPGVGELKARAPGSSDEGRPLTLARQSVSVHIAGQIARTEIEQEFSSDDSQTLEGIYRFPVPPDAQIERLALQVDGHWQEGAFVTRDRGAAIWQGVIAHATPKPVMPKPEIEWIWVPGPWHDPALLEWKNAGRMELKIFPIPAHGSRKIALAYTQKIDRTAEGRTYVYPLPRLGMQSRGIGEFHLDLSVIGFDSSRPVVTKGYDFADSSSGDVVRKSMNARQFIPQGDFVVNYARKAESALAMSYAYQTPSGDSFVALSLHPKYPALLANGPRLHTIIVDSSRSMVGERFIRATALANRMVRLMDPSDRVMVFACDLRCKPIVEHPETPSDSLADRVAQTLSTITPEGASNLEDATQFAYQNLANNKSGMRASVIYLGDGAATIGARNPVDLEASVRRLSREEQTSFVGVAIGVDSDTTGLDAMARGTGGVVVPYTPRQGLNATAYDVLESASASYLRDVRITLPEGLRSATPTSLPAVRMASELMVVAKASAPVSGDVLISGHLGGQPWETRIPVNVTPTSDSGNAFVPRLFAAETIASMQRDSTSNREDIIALSTQYSVPSRFTSLLVLESDAMAKAFGVSTLHPPVMWTGDEQARGQESANLQASPRPVATSAAWPSGFRALGGSSGADLATGPAANQPPSEHAHVAEKKDNETPADDAIAVGKANKTSARRRPFPDGGRYVAMRREWHRTAKFVEGDSWSPTALDSQISAAQNAFSANPNSREKLANLFGLQSARDPDLASQLMQKWVERDPLDSLASLRRAELIEREGRRSDAIRVLTSSLEDGADNPDLADNLAQIAARSGDMPLSCALRSVRPEARPNDLAGIARRVRCLRQLGDDTLAQNLVQRVDSSEKSTLDSLLSGPESNEPKAWGDLRIEANFADQTGADLDIGLVDPNGIRLSWMSANARVAVEDATSRSHEVIALPWVGTAGTYTIEMTTSDPSDHAEHRGNILVQFLGETHNYSFAMQSSRKSVARFTLGWESSWVPVSDGCMPGMMCE